MGRRDHELHADFISAVAVYPGEGVREEASEQALSAAFEQGGYRLATRLRRTEEVAEEECWVKAPGWSFGVPVTSLRGGERVARPRAVCAQAYCPRMTRAVDPRVSTRLMTTIGELDPAGGKAAVMANQAPSGRF